LTALPSTPSQTVGPFFAFGLCIHPQNELVATGDAGAIEIRGTVLDGAGDPLEDAMVEIWQADADGRYRADFGWARCGTDLEGRFGFRTVKPGAVGDQAPHLDLLVFARGLLKPVYTRLYFPDEQDANAADPVLAALPEDERSTLVAVADGDALRFEVRLQGERQTTFFVL
jgi:protocatechuate 3,4-dioxygenase, alpha subunit